MTRAWALEVPNWGVPKKRRAKVLIEIVWMWSILEEERLDE